VLRLDPAGSPYRLPCVDPTSHPGVGYTLHSVTIVAVNGSSRPKIGCETTAAAAGCSLSVDNTTLIGVDLEVGDCHVIISGSHLRDSTINTTRTCRSLRMRVTRTDWTFSGHVPCRRSTDPCTLTFRNWLACASIDVTLDRVRLVLGLLAILSKGSTHVYVVGSQFTGDPENPDSQFLGGLHMSFSPIGSNVNITVVDCIFSTQASHLQHYLHHK